MLLSCSSTGERKYTCSNSGGSGVMKENHSHWMACSVDGVSVKICLDSEGSLCVRLFAKVCSLLCATITTQACQRQHNTSVCG